ncbi:MAG: glycosyltransferase family 9 protein [Proteobacteria bacterium]|nr:glycosyltransferase family 9 protein [Pseudomonadota bacterium]
MKKILVIKLGALGDFLQALGPFKAIRDHYKNDHVTLLTTPAFKEIAEDSGYFNAVMAFPRLKGRQIFKLLKRIFFLKSENFEVIYDLQTSSHTSRYFYYLRLMGWRGEFSGIAYGCTYPHKNKHRDLQHTLERQKEQLNDAGLFDVPFPDLSFLRKKKASDEVLDVIHSQRPFVILVPGGAPTRLDKRWPLQGWLEILKRLQAQRITTVIIGGGGEKNLNDAFKPGQPFLINLIGKTNFVDLAHLGAHALCALGNDTGPMHLLALSGCPSTVLFNLNASNPDLCGPKGKKVCYLCEKDLSRLEVDHVWKNLLEHKTEVLKKDFKG